MTHQYQGTFNPYTYGMQMKPCGHSQDPQKSSEWRVDTTDIGNIDFLVEGAPRYSINPTYYERPEITFRFDGKLYRVDESRVYYSLDYGWVKDGKKLPW